MNAFKRCSVCRHLKFIEHFRKKSSKDPRPRSLCRECHSKKSLEWNKTHPDEIEAAARRFKESNPGYANKRYHATKHSINKTDVYRRKFEYDLAWKYKLSVEDWAILFNHQNGKCACCYRAFFVDCTVCVDHHHKSGVVRGLLCLPCNRILGLAYEKPTTLLALAMYLETSAAFGVSL